MKLLRTTALTAALIAIAVPSLTSSAQAWRGWRGAGWGWRGAALGAAAVGTALAARSYYGGYGYGGYGYGTGYSYPSYGYGYGTGYNPPGPFTPAFGGPGYGYATTSYSYPPYGSGYGTGYRNPGYGAYRAAYHPVTGRRIYATAAGIHHYRHYH